jgi:DNA-binding CsgD family transcriptional regulator
VPAWADPILLERDEPLATLTGAAAAAGGSMILVGGEAGIGKTSLVRRVARDVGPAWLGACDPLETPRPLGPLIDMAPDIVSGSPSRGDVLAAVLARLSTADAPPLVIFEDVHWADQATLDLLRFLGRRVDRVRAAIVVTFREEELPGREPLAVLLGDLATAPGVTRLRLAPLSMDATAAMVGASGADAADVFERTGGNPFFINAVLASGGAEVPSTVREAVLARLSRVAAETRMALETAAAFGPRMDPAELATILDRLRIPRWTMRDGVFTGLLRWQEKTLEFRHELVQAAIRETTEPSRRQRLHGVIFGVLQGIRLRPEHGAELVGHAEGAGDDKAVLSLAPRAAEWAASRAAHREAAALYRKAIDRAHAEPARTRAELVEQEAGQRYLSGDLAAAREGHRAAATLFRSIGDRLGEGRNLVRVSALSFLTGNYADVDPAAGAVDDVLAGLPPSRELAMAYDNQSRQQFMAGNTVAATEWADKALAVAEELDDAEAALTARISRDGARLFGGDHNATGDLRLHVRSAQTMRLADHTARALLYLGWLPILHRRYDGLEPVLDQGLRFTAQRGLTYWEQLISGARINFLLDQGRWDEVESPAAALIEREDSITLTVMQAQAVLTRLRARRGEQAGTLLDSLRDNINLHGKAGVFSLAEPAMAEADWLAGNHDRLLREAREAVATSDGVHYEWWYGELAYWCHRAGGPPMTDGPIAEPYRLAIAGDWAAAAEWWAARDCPYETAIALSEGDDPDAVRGAIDTLDRLGAKAAAGHARRRLKELGVTTIPRGPRPATQANKAGLTRREAEVLDLMAHGLTNPEIAKQLFLSGKTVERHVSAVLRKLDATARAEAVDAARRVGVLPPS